MAELVVVDILFWPLDDRWGLYGRSRLNAECRVFEKSIPDADVGGLSIYPLGKVMRSETFKTLEPLPDALHFPFPSPPLRILFHLFLDADTAGS